MKAIANANTIEAATLPRTAADTADGAAPARPRVSAGVAAVTNYHLFLALAALFLVSNAIFAFALRPAPAAAVLVGCAGVAALLSRSSFGPLLRAGIDARYYALCLALGLALCLLGGGLHVFRATTDWLTRDAVLADLVSNGLTVLYRWEGQDYLLRAPLGMYMVPAVVGRFYGLFAAHVALFLQNSFIVATIFYLTAQIGNVRKTPLLLLIIFFSGMDIIPVVVSEAIEIFRYDNWMPFAHIEWWGEYWTKLRLQYSSHITQLFWVPNHMAPGWWFATLALLHARKEIDLAALAISSVPLLLWSPLAMMGAAPFVLLFAAGQGLGLIQPRNFVAAALGVCFVPIALYLTLDAGAVQREWYILQDGFFLNWLVFLLIEIPQVAVIALAWKKVEAADRRLVILAVAILAALPVYSIGPSNDFVMRASIPALFIVAFVFARIAVLTPRDDSAFPTFIGLIVLISFATPMLEFKQALDRTYAISDCNLITIWSKLFKSDLPTNYWARVETAPSWLLVADTKPLLAQERKCWPDHPLLKDEFK